MAGWVGARTIRPHFSARSARTLSFTIPLKRTPGAGIASRKRNRFVSSAMRYGVSVLAEDQRALSDHFAGRATEDVRIHFVSRAGAALLNGAIVYFVVRVEDIHPAGDHTLYVGSVEYFESRDDKPLLFYAGSYQQRLVRRVKPLPISILDWWIQSLTSSLSAGSNFLSECRRRAGAVLKAALRIDTHGRY
jgi:hypothetical protein